MNPSDIGLSQEEIDALMGGGSEDESSSASLPLTNDQLNNLKQLEEDCFRGLAEITGGVTMQECAILSVELTATSAIEVNSILTPEDFSVGCKSGKQNYQHAFVLDKDSVAAVITAVMGSFDGLDETNSSLPKELFSQVAGGMSTNMAKVFREAVSVELGDILPEANTSTPDLFKDPIYFTTFNLKFGEDSIQIKHFFDNKYAFGILEAKVTSDEIQAQKRRDEEAKAAKDEVLSKQQAKQAPPAQMPSSQPAYQPPPIQQTQENSAPIQYAPAQFQQISIAGNPVDPRNIELLLDVPLMVTVELGKTRTPIKTILELGEGSLITLDKLSGEPVDLLVNGKYFARGEVVVIEENFGVRISSILSVQERMQMLG